MDPKEKTERLVEYLEMKYGNVGYPKSSPFQVLIRTIISQRNRDEITDYVFNRSFSSLGPREIAGIDVKTLEKMLKPAGLYRQKARSILKTCHLLVEKYGGEVPGDREELMSLPGVGGKTADIVLSYGFGKDVVACDTHVVWITNAVGIVNTEDPEKVRERLMELIPKGHRKMFNIRAVEFGKEICITSRPRCDLCGLNNICDYFRNVYSKRKEG